MIPMVVSIIAETEQFQRDCAKVRLSIEDMQKSLKQGGWKNVDLFNNKEIKTAFSLQEKLFASTHTGLETAMRNHDMYFASLSAKWAGNEQMMTSITQLEAANRTAILEKYSGKADEQSRGMIKNITSFSRAIGGLARLAGIVYVANSLMNVATAMSKAKREGDNMFGAMLANLPLINRVAESFKKMADELSGLTAAEERLDYITKMSDSLMDINKDIGDELQLLNATEEERKKINIQREYESRINAINEKMHSEEVENAKRINEQIDLHTKKLDKLSTIQKALLVISNISPLSMYSTSGKYGMAGKEKLPEFEILAQADREKAEKLRVEALAKLGIEINENYIKKILQDNIKFYEELGDYGEQWLEQKTLLLEMEAEKYRKMGATEIQIAKWIQAQISKVTAKDINKEIVDTTRDAIDQIRHMDNLTRQERIANLNAYKEAHKETLGKVVEAEKLLDEEIRNLQRSRQNALNLYYAELKENMTDSSTYLSEQFADVAKQMQSSLGDAFFNMISEGASWKDAMEGFFKDVGRAFGRMAANMAAEASAYGIAKMIGFAVTSGISTQHNWAGGNVPGGGLGDVGVPPPSAPPTTGTLTAHRGGIIGYDDFQMRQVSSSMFANAPRLHGGLRSDEYPAILQRGEEVIPKNKVDRYNPQINIKNIIVRNEKEAYIEAMNSAEGEKVIIQKVARNRNVLG